LPLVDFGSAIATLSSFEPILQTSALAICDGVGSLPELVRDGETGRLVDMGDVEALADVLCELLDDPVRRAELGARGRAHLGATWNWENAARHLLAAVREGLGQPQVTRKRESHRRPGA